MGQRPELMIKVLENILCPTEFAKFSRVSCTWLELCTCASNLMPSMEEAKRRRWLRAICLNGGGLAALRSNIPLSIWQVAYNTWKRSFHSGDIPLNPFIKASHLHLRHQLHHKQCPLTGKWLLARLVEHVSPTRALYLQRRTTEQDAERKLRRNSRRSLKPMPALEQQWQLP